ncbi:hypothetical protein ACO2I3_06245 [Leptospira interrogans]
MKLVSPMHSVALAVLFVAISTGGAHAYLDPGTGSMILQILLGGLAGLAIAGRLYWNKFLLLLGLRSEREDKSGEKSR